MRLTQSTAIYILVAAAAAFILYTYFTKATFEPFEDKPLIPYMHPAAELKKSRKIGERGVFATKDYRPGDLIEVCPAIKQTHSKVDGQLSNYVFDYDAKHSLIGFGYCSMYNHSDTNNAEWEVINEHQIKMVALSNIAKGEEIFISYGDEYWEGKNTKR